LAGSTVPDEDTESVMVPVDTVCTVVFVVMVGVALELLEKNSASIPTPRPAPTIIRMTAIVTVRLLENHLLRLGITPLTFRGSSG
jgi:hypothetical protein